MRKLGIMVVGVAVGLVITGMLIEQERQAAENNADAEKRNGLFAEICGADSTDSLLGILFRALPRPDCAQYHDNRDNQAAEFLLAYAMYPN